MDLFLYFDSHGIGPSNINSEDSVLNGLWETILVLDYAPHDADSHFKLLTYFDNIIDESFDSGYLLYALPINLQPDCSDEAITSSRRCMEILKRKGYDFEKKNTVGRTPLLDHLAVIGRQSLETVRLFLGLGVNIHATDIIGRNALQSVMYGSPRERHRDILEQRQRDILQQKLCLLIKAGADVNHCDDYGDTPSDCAREQYRCWDEWCRALESNGLDIDEVIHADAERHEAFGSRRDRRAKTKPKWSKLPSWEKAFLKRPLPLTCCPIHSGSDSDWTDRKGGREAQINQISRGE